MPDNAKKFLDNLNRWALLLQLLVIAVPLAIWVYEQGDKMEYLQEDVAVIKTSVESNHHEYSRNHMAYIQNLSSIREDLSNKKDDHREFRTGQTQLTRTLDKLVIVLESVDSELKNRRN